MSKYVELSNEQPVLNECFFAFSKEQFEEGIKKHGLEGKKLSNAGGGLIGTKDGINEMIKFYEDRDRRIKEACTPQEVYDYEYNNHECLYSGDDTPAIDIVTSIFGKEALILLERYSGCWEQY